MARRPKAGGRLTVAEDEDRQAGQSEKDEVSRDDVAEDLLVRTRPRDDDGSDTLKHDGHNWNVRSRMNASDAAEEHSVLRHGVVNPRSSEHALAEEAEGGDGD